MKTEIIPNNPANKSVINSDIIVCDRGVCGCAGGVVASVLEIINPPKISHHANRSEKAENDQ